ncbi:ubiquitin binding protein [Artomyces pyxidatus]|uniref:Ubiquitin binding protein n=1 Tax=Artomyces pyxidatus TaxID=48021 RepID=A0ACB8T2Y5_9AGAM|nr:ubiquitin binding protein [Artomyces pyxidatus]
MSSLSNWLWGTNQLDEAIDKATSELIPIGSEDMALNLEICDQIRSKSAPPKDAMRALRRRLNHKNPNVQLLALSLTDVCIKNGGDHFLVEVASREFMDNFVSLLKMPNLNRDVKNKTLRYIQTWAISMEGKPALSYVVQIYKTLKNEGFNFPPEDLAVASTAMVDTKTAPEWVESDICFHCRDTFTFTNRKHHCRNCGRVFDQKCSSKSLPLPHFGITQEVRVCDGCYPELTKTRDKALGADTKRHRSSHSVPNLRRSARDLADAELQRAIQLSLEEVSARGEHGRPGYVPSQPDSWHTSEPPLVERSSRPAGTSEEEEDPDLKAAIEASLREANAPKPSAPIGLETPRVEELAFSYAGAGYSQSYPPAAAPSQPSVPALPNYDLGPMEADTILTFSQTVEQVQAQGGRDMSRYPAVTQLFDNANNLRPKLAMSLDDTGRKEDLLTEMNDKLSQAVKLYDKILTEQLSRPTWRTQRGAPPQATSYPPQEASYNQWNSSQTAVSIQPTYSPQQQPTSPGYAAAPSQPFTPRESVYAQQTQPQKSWSQYAESPSAVKSYSPQNPYTAAPGPSHSPAVPPTQYSPSYQPVAAPLPQQTSTGPVSIPQSPLQQPSQYFHAPQSPITVPTQHPQRYNTYHAVSSPPPSIHATIARQSTVSHASAAPQQYTPPPSAPLPSFPSAPTAPPSGYPMYDPSYATSVEQTEKKEALLIDL